MPSMPGCRCALPPRPDGAEFRSYIFRPIMCSTGRRAHPMSSRMRWGRLTSTAAASSRANWASAPATRGISSCARRGSTARTATISSRRFCGWRPNVTASTVVADQRGCPTAARDIAKTCLDVAMRLRGGAGRGALRGLSFRRGRGRELVRVRHGDRRDVRRPAGRRRRWCRSRRRNIRRQPTRPLDTRLDCTAIVRTFGVSLRPWREALEETIDRLLANKDSP